MTVNLVTIHHEGAGSPTDTPRGADGGYTYWIGPTKWTRLRSVSASFATYHYNGRSVDICLSGNRETHDVTPADIMRIGAAVADARSRGEVVDKPAVRAHRDSPGSRTVCPGRETMRDFAAIITVCQTTPRKVTPMFNPPLDSIVSGVRTDEGAWIVRRDGAVYTIAGRYYGGANTLPEWGTRTAAAIVAANGRVPNAAAPPIDEKAAGYAYVVIATTGERYGLPAGGR